MSPRMSPRASLTGYLAAVAISITGTRVTMIAIPWLVLTTTGSATRTGLVAFAEMLPLVVMQALAGPLLDRLGARLVAITCDLGSVAAVGAIPLLHLSGALTFPVLLGLVAVAGCLRGPGDAAKHALVPVMVAHAGVDTEKVTGLLGAVERTASMAGAALAGLLVAGIGSANALIADAASFGLCGLLLLVAVPATLPGREQAEPVERLPYREELRSGWDFMRRDPVLMGIGVMVAITNLLDQAWSAVLVPVWARESGHGVHAVGWLFACFSASAIVGSLLAAQYAARLPRFKVYVLAFFVAGVPRFVVMALDSPLWLILGVGLCGGFAAGFLNPILGAVLFERIPDRLMGRVTAMNLAMSWSLIPLGGLLGGLLVSGVGIAPALVVVGTAYFLTTMAPTVQPRWRELDDRPDRARIEANDSAEPSPEPQRT